MDLTGFAFFLAIGAIGASILLGPMGQALGRRMGANKGSGNDPDSAARIADLEQRIMDLEERLDFAERVLSQERAPDRLPGMKG